MIRRENDPPTGCLNGCIVELVAIALAMIFFSLIGGTLHRPSADVCNEQRANR